MSFIRARRERYAFWNADRFTPCRPKRSRHAAAECSTRFPPPGFSNHFCIFRAQATDDCPFPNSRSASVQIRSLAW